MSPAHELNGLDILKFSRSESELETRLAEQLGLVKGDLPGSQLGKLRQEKKYDVLG